MPSIKYNKCFFYMSTQAESRIACHQYSAKGRCQWLLFIKRVQPIAQEEIYDQEWGHSWIAHPAKPWVRLFLWQYVSGTETHIPLHPSHIAPSLVPGTEQDNIWVNHGQVPRGKESMSEVRPTNMAGLISMGIHHWLCLFSKRMKKRSSTQGSESYYKGQPTPQTCPWLLEHSKQACGVEELCFPSSDKKHALGATPRQESIKPAAPTLDLLFLTLAFTSVLLSSPITSWDERSHARAAVRPGAEV